MKELPAPALGTTYPEFVEAHAAMKKKLFDDSPFLEDRLNWGLEGLSTYHINGTLS